MWYIWLLDSGWLGQHFVVRGQAGSQVSGQADTKFSTVVAYSSLKMA